MSIAAIIGFIFYFLEVVVQLLLLQNKIFLVTCFWKPTFKGLWKAYDSLPLVGVG